MLLLTDATGEARFLGATGISRVQGPVRLRGYVTLGTHRLARDPRRRLGEAVPCRCLRRRRVITPLTVPAATTRCDDAVTALERCTRAAVNLVGIVQIRRAPTPARRAHRAALRGAPEDGRTHVRRTRGLGGCHRYAPWPGRRVRPRLWFPARLRARRVGRPSAAPVTTEGCWPPPTLRRPRRSVCIGRRWRDACDASVDGLSSQLSNMAAYIPDCPTREAWPARRRAGDL